VEFHFLCEAIVAAALRCHAGGYQRGAAFVFESDGMMFKGNYSYVIPLGTKAYLRDQWAANPDSINVTKIVFEREVIMSFLEVQLEELNFGKGMRAALEAVQQYLLRGAGSAPQVAQEQMVEI
jgi:hypothetical protein